MGGETLSHPAAEFVVTVAPKLVGRPLYASVMARELIGEPGTALNVREAGNAVSVETGLPPPDDSGEMAMDNA